MLNINHIILYAKGFYHREDLIEDMKKCLRLENYDDKLLENDYNIRKIIFSECSKLNITEFKDTHYFINEFIVYFKIYDDYDEAVIKYCLDKLRGIEFELIKPDYKVFKKPNSVSNENLEEL
jgi:hypothetical protein